MFMTTWSSVALTMSPFFNDVYTQAERIPYEIFSDDFSTTMNSSIDELNDEWVLHHRQNWYKRNNERMAAVSRLLTVHFQVIPTWGDPAEGGIIELKRRFYSLVLKHGIPDRAWDFVLDYVKQTDVVKEQMARWTADVSNILDAKAGDIGWGEMRSRHSWCLTLNWKTQNSNATSTS